jgi:hypothetical protein
MYQNGVDVPGWKLSWWSNNTDCKVGGSRLRWYLIAFPFFACPYTCCLVLRQPPITFLTFRILIWNLKFLPSTQTVTGMCYVMLGHSTPNFKDQHMVLYDYVKLHAPVNAMVDVKDMADWQLSAMEAPIMGFRILPSGSLCAWPSPSPQHHWLTTTSVPCLSAIHTRFFPFFKEGVMTIYTINICIWWRADCKASPDLVFNFLFQQITG